MGGHYQNLVPRDIVRLLVIRRKPKMITSAVKIPDAKKIYELSHCIATLIFKVFDDVTTDASN